MTEIAINTNNNNTNYTNNTNTDYNTNYNNYSKNKQNLWINTNELDKFKNIASPPNPPTIKNKYKKNKYKK
tara:strand:- start:6372 stop:6584 length:213 start_codon:yes stop_codon:yes gene_type:complete